MLVIGIPLALRQFLLGSYYDTAISLIIFIGVFLLALYDLTWDLLLPVLFSMAALYILLREFQESREHPEDEEEEDLNLEIEEKEAEEAPRKKPKN